MKEKKSAPDAVQQKPSHKPYNLWRAVAIGMILVFCLFVAGGLIKLYHFKSELIKPSQAQIDTAITAAKDELIQLGQDSSGLSAKVADLMRHPRGEQRNIIQVMLYNETVSYTFIVDVDTGKVILRTETVLYEPAKKFPLWERPGPIPPPRHR